MNRHRLCCLNLLLLAITVTGTPEQPSVTFEDLYQYGKRDYTDENWSDCAGFMLRAIEDYNYYRDETLWCREKCEQQINELPRDLLISDDDFIVKLGLQFGTAQKALCLMRCRIDRFTEDRPPMSNYDTYEAFQLRKPYYYLQFCYWKMKDMKNAVKSAYTYLVANPTDENAYANIQFYEKQPGFEKSMLVDVAQMSYEKTYMSGVEAYEAEDWTRCNEELTASLAAFFAEEKRCRWLCEDYLDWSVMQGDNPEMSIVSTSIHSSVLRCQNECADKLSSVNGYRIKNILASYFEYLTVCQFNLKRGRDAAQSVANALLLDPKNVIMRRNRLFYTNQFNDESLFEPTKEIVRFHQKRVLEQRLLAFVNERFKYDANKLLPTERMEDRAPLNVEVEVTDSFDYSQITDAVLTADECKMLHVAAEFPSSAKPFVPQLIDEVRDRIHARYSSDPEFASLTCHKHLTKSGCKRAAFVLAVDSERCSATLSDEFSGCALVYCLD